MNNFLENVENAFVLILQLKKRGVVLYTKGCYTQDFMVCNHCSSGTMASFPPLLTQLSQVQDP